MEWVRSKLDEGIRRVWINILLERQKLWLWIWIIFVSYFWHVRRETHWRVLWVRHSVVILCETFNDQNNTSQLAPNQQAQHPQLEEEENNEKWIIKETEKIKNEFLGRWHSAGTDFLNFAAGLVDICASTATAGRRSLLLVALWQSWCWDTLSELAIAE